MGPFPPRLSRPDRLPRSTFRRISATWSGTPRPNMVYVADGVGGEGIPAQAVVRLVGPELEPVRVAAERPRGPESRDPPADDRDASRHPLPPPSRSRGSGIVSPSVQAGERSADAHRRALPPRIVARPVRPDNGAGAGGPRPTPLPPGPAPCGTSTRTRGVRSWGRLRYPACGWLLGRRPPWRRRKSVHRDARRCRVALNINLTIDGNCREAIDFCRSDVGIEFAEFQTSADGPAEVLETEGTGNLVIRLALPLGSSVLMDADSSPAAGSPHLARNHFSIGLEGRSREHCESVSARLPEGGEVTMPLQETFRGAYFGRCIDRFAVDWMINVRLPVGGATRCPLRGGMRKARQRIWRRKSRGEWRTGLRGSIPSPRRGVFRSISRPMCRGRRTKAPTAAARYSGSGGHDPVRPDRSVGSGAHDHPAAAWSTPVRGCLGPWSGWPTGAAAESGHRTGWPRREV